MSQFTSLNDDPEGMLESKDTKISHSYMKNSFLKAAIRNDMFTWQCIVLSMIILANMFGMSIYYQRVMENTHTLALGIAILVIMHGVVAVSLFRIHRITSHHPLVRYTGCDGPIPDELLRDWHKQEMSIHTEQGYSVERRLDRLWRKMDSLQNTIDRMNDRHCNNPNPLLS